MTMSQGRFSPSRYFWVTLGTFVLFASTFALYVWSEKHLDRANELRQQADRLADELRQSSDDLTRMVRSYVVTGDAIYKQHYEEILDIRDGKKARPVAYQSIYWDLVLADDQRPRPPGPAVPLLDLMRRSGFTEEEFAKLLGAKANSDALTRLEFAAMALIESAAPPSEADRARAIGMLYGAAYHEAKAGIMRPISEFHEIADRRTLEAIQDAKAYAARMRVAFLLFGLLLVSLLWAARRHLHAILGGTVVEVQRRIAELGSGNSSPVSPVAAGMENSMLGLLSQTQTNLGRIDEQRRQAEGEVLDRSKELGDSVVASMNMMEDAVRQRENAERAYAELEQTESLKGAILEASLDCIITIDHAGNMVEFNPAAEAAFGLTRAQALGRSMVDLIVPARLRDAHSRGFAHYLATGEGPVLGKRLELQAVRADGTEFPIELAITVIGGTSKPMFTGFLRDITERKGAADRIAYLSRVHAVLSGINTLIVRVHDRDELFREACRIAVDKGGFRMAWIAMADPLGGKLVPVASAGVGAELLSSIRQHYASDERLPQGTTMEARAMREKKAIVAKDLQRNPDIRLARQHAEGGVLSIAVLPLIVSTETVGVLALLAGENEFFHEEELTLLTELAGDIAFAIDHIEKEKKLHYLAYYDALTGLANRSLFLERVAQYMRSATTGGHKLAVGLIDLERFKNINDSLGQPAGDELLRQVAEWLTRNLGDASLLSRVGADHFAVVLPHANQAGSVAGLVDKLMNTFLDHPFHIGDGIFRVAAKVGVALFPDDSADADTLLKNAEAALKKAKARGDRYLFYKQSMTASVAGRLTLENQLRQALDKEEFVLHYQPKVSLASGLLTGAEALIRWNDPRRGLVPPGQFIPVLEETGLINEVGRWALRRASEDYLRWRTAGLAPVRIAVNVSPLQLRNRDFIAEVREAIGIDAHAGPGLELEITESLIMEDVKHSIASLEAIRAMGVRIAIDDFGTGFSSLSYLAKLPVDTLKIDRSFVTDMTASPEGLSLVSTIIKLAHSLNLHVVAEGVETEEQSRLLRLLDCDEIQGYLFSRPVPCDIFETTFLSPAPRGPGEAEAGRRPLVHS